MRQLIDTGRTGDLSAVVNFGNPLTSKAKEAVLQKIADRAAPAFDDFDSKVRKELDTYLAKGGKLETKEQEEAWQVRLRDETQAWLASKAERNAEKQKRAEEGEREIEKAKQKLSEDKPRRGRPPKVEENNNQ